MHFYEYFRLELFSRKLNFEQTCYCHGLKENEFETNVSPQEVEKDLLKSVLVDKVKYMYIYENFREELFL